MRRSLILFVAALLLTGCETESMSPHRRNHAKTVTQTLATPGKHLAPYVTRDPAKFPKMASHLAFNFGDGSTNSHFALNVVRGCNPAVADRSIELNPKQVNFIVPGTEVSRHSTECGAEDGFAVTYGNGYWTATSTIRSPRSGFGTVRPFNADKDIAHYEDGERAFSDSEWVLNMFSSGGKNTTAEWAARVKAHWTLANLGGSLSKHKGVQGVWGDNFLWWNRNLDSARSSGGKPLRGTRPSGTTDSSETTRSSVALLGPDFLLGGNGAGWACSGYTHVLRNYSQRRAARSADAAMWEDAGSVIYDAAGWDRFIPYFDGWIKAGATEGRQKYGIMAEYGTLRIREPGPSAYANRRAARLGDGDHRRH